MKRLLINIFIATFAVGTIALGILLFKNFFPGEFYIIKNSIFTSKADSLTLTKEKNISTERIELSKLLEIAEKNDSLLLVNETYNLSEDYEPALIDLNGKEVYINSCAEKSFRELKDSVKSEYDNNLYIMSSFRTPEEQEQLIESGNDYATAKYASEHLTGLALDVYVMYYAGMGFIDSEEGRFVNSNCQDYGFIIRYPNYGTNITGITYEPWHIRYVGFPHSKIIMENRLTLEEYILSFEDGEFYSYGDYIISRQKNGKYFYIPTDINDITICDDNTGCIIITGKR